MIRWSMPYTLVLGSLMGIAIGYIDSRPGWDDTGVTATVVFLGSALLGAVRPGSAMLAGLGVGIPVLLFNVSMGRGYGAMFAVGVALLGAALGWAAGRTIRGGLS